MAQKVFSAPLFGFPEWPVRGFGGLGVMLEGLRDYRAGIVLPGAPLNIPEPLCFCDPAFFLTAVLLCGLKPKENRPHPRTAFWHS